MPIKTELRAKMLAIMRSTNDMPHQAVPLFKESAEQGSNGELLISVHPAGELVTASPACKACVSARLILRNRQSVFHGLRLPEMNVIDLPFLSGFTPEHAYRVLDGEVGQTLLDGLSKHNMKGLALWEIGFRNITIICVRSVCRPDLQGMKIAYHLSTLRTSKPLNCSVPTQRRCRLQNCT
ncbi:MAG: hypothetical protein R3F53_16480 [Gammaproteobacteria bacterium]